MSYEISINDHLKFGVLGVMCPECNYKGLLNDVGAHFKCPRCKRIFTEKEIREGCGL